MPFELVINLVDMLAVCKHVFFSCKSRTYGPSSGRKVCSLNADHAIWSVFNQ